jgi:hypothetical protein
MDADEGCRKTSAMPWTVGVRPRRRDKSEDGGEGAIQTVAGNDSFE